MNKASFWDRNKATIKFCLIFGYCIAVLFFLAHTKFAHETVGKVYPEFVARIVRGILSLMGIGVSTKGNIVISKGFAMEIIYHCSAVFASIIYVSAIVAYPAPYIKKLVGVLMGVPLLACINIFRLVVMFVIGLRYPRVFELFHNYLWQGVFIIFVVALWMVWIEKMVEK